MLRGAVWCRAGGLSTNCEMRGLIQMPLEGSAWRGAQPWGLEGREGRRVFLGQQQVIGLGTGVSINQGKWGKMIRQ